MNKYFPKKINTFLPDIPINSESKDKLFSLASSHDLSGLEEFITTNSISLNVKNNNNETIMHALLNGESSIDEQELLRCIKFLVERGAPISSIDNNNLTPLFICIKKKYSKIFKFLLDNNASLDINTHDDLTVLHEIAKPEYITYDGTGIKDLIPEKVPKITMEGYEQVYEKIVDAIFQQINDTTDTSLKTNFDKFKTIAKQFYYHDEREDFNNVLLLEETSSNPNIKNELFKKLQNQLKDFYTSDIIENIPDLNAKLNNITNELNNELAQNNMRTYNDNVFNSIKNLTLSLELSNHFFFTTDPAKTYIANTVIIEIAKAAAAAAQPVTQVTAIVAALQTTKIRPIIQAVKAATIAPRTTLEIINLIQKTAIYTVVANTGASVTNVDIQRDINAAVLSTAPPGSQLEQLFNAIKANAANAIVPNPLSLNVDAGLAAYLVPGSVNVNATVTTIITNASRIVIRVEDIETLTRTTITAIPAANQIKVIAVIYTAIRAATYAAVYMQNKVLAAAAQPKSVTNLTVVHAAVQSAVEAGLSRIQVDEVQRALTDPEVAVEAAIYAASKAATTAQNIANNTPDIVIEAVKEALENIEANKEAISIIIEIAKATATAQAALTPLVAPVQQVTAIVAALQTTKIRPIIQAVKAATIAPRTTLEIINLIQKTAIYTVVANTGASVTNVDIQRDINAAVLSTAPPGSQLEQLFNAIKANAANAIVPNPLSLNVDAGLAAYLVPGSTVNVNATVTTIITNASRIVIRVGDIETLTINAITAIPSANQIKVIAVIYTAIRAAIYAVLYTGNKELEAIGQPVANLPSVHAAVQSAVEAGLIGVGIDQAEVQRALTDPEVAIEATIYAASKSAYLAQVVQTGAGNAGAGNTDVIIAAVKEALLLPQIISKQFKNNDYNELIKSYKLINIPQKYFNYNISYKYPDNYIETNIKQAISLINYKLPEGDRNYIIDYFNLLYTFNEYTRNNYNPQNPVNITNPFELYQNIQQIYKYNYIIYIFEKEKDKISALKNSYTLTSNIELKKNIDTIFDEHYKELEKNVNLIKQELKKIEKLANEYIDIYNKINGNKIYTPNINPIYIGVYPKIQFPTEIKYTLSDENSKIAECNDYSKYNKHKNEFFHNFVLYFQDIGHNILSEVSAPNSLLNNIPRPIDYNIIINNYNTNNDDNKNKAYKLYYYDPIYLKLEKQNIINQLLANQKIVNINIPKFSNYNTTIKDKLTIEIKNKILNEILEEQFNNNLVIEINNFFKNKLTIKIDELTYEIQIKEPDFNAMLLSSAGFSSILIPNYEFKNNKFLSISKNNFLKLKLYFDTNYFKIFENPKLSNNLELKYYKENTFIEEVLKNNRSLLLKTDIKGWTPIYYAIDGNNYEVIKEILECTQIDTLIHYDYKKISPLKLCINKQLNHLNYLLTDNNKEIHYLNNYIKMLRNELKSNNVLIPLNIESIFIIALFIQNHIWSDNANTINLTNIKKLKKLENTRKTQINKEYNDIKIIPSDVNNKFFNYNDNDVKNDIILNRIYIIQENKNYNYSNSDDNNIILKKYYDQAKKSEKLDFGFYGSYWKNYKNNEKILKHIVHSKKIKIKLQKYLKLKEDVKFGLPSYNKKNITALKANLVTVQNKLEHYLKFINIRFNSNKDNAYNVFLNKIYVHVLANIIGVDFYLKMEELIVKHYMNLNINIDQLIQDPAFLTDTTKQINPVKEQLKNLNKLLINNKLDDSNVNYRYISATKNPELALKKDIIDILNNEFIPNNEELINIFETKVYPNYRDLYKITFKYLQMFISNYHKFIYNQYHGLEILLLLLVKLETISS